MKDYIASSILVSEVLNKISQYNINRLDKERQLTYALNLIEQAEYLSRIGEYEDAELLYEEINNILNSIGAHSVKVDSTITKKGEIALSTEDLCILSCEDGTLIILQ